MMDRWKDRWKNRQMGNKLCSLICQWTGERWVKSTVEGIVDDFTQHSTLNTS